MQVNRIFATALWLLIFINCINAQTASQRKRLIELNTAIQDLDQKAQEISNQKKILEDERRQLLEALAKDQFQQQYENSDGYLVVSIDGNSDITLLVNGNPKWIHLYGIYISKRAEAQLFLKSKLVSGTAYVRCTNEACSWVYLYDKKDGKSLNAQLFEQGYATVVDSTALDESKHIYNRDKTATASQDTTPEPSTEPSYTSKPTPGTEVHVRGYTRKDGTYVQPHTRSAPRRRP